MLTNEIFPTSGEVYIGGKPLSDPSTQQMLGYCPQVDPLLDLMNGYETLWFFGRIRGIKPDILQARVDALIDQTGLGPHAHRPCGTYSGGNKRKLSLAVALIGDPKVLLLDEVSMAMYVVIWTISLTRMCYVHTLSLFCSPEFFLSHVLLAQHRYGSGGKTTYVECDSASVLKSHGDIGESLNGRDRSAVYKSRGNGIRETAMFRISAAFEREVRGWI